MATQEPRREDPPVPPVGEQIHLPDPTYIPVVVAAGLTIALVGIVMSWWLFAVGMVIWVLPTIRWIADTRRDIADLPLEQGGEHQD